MMPTLCFFADGQSPHTQRWLNAMVQRGYRVILITPRPSLLDQVVVIPIKRLPTVFGWFFAIPKIRRLMRELKPDVVHGHYLTSYGLWAVSCGIRPVVLTAWGSDILVTPHKHRFYQWLTRYIVRKADLITADAESALQALQPFFPTAQLQQVQWGVDVQHFKPCSPSHNSFNIISLRAWETNYNISDILTAVAELRRQCPEIPVRLDLLGGGSLATQLEQQLIKLELQSVVTVHGHVNEAQLLNLLQQADVSISVPSSDATAMSVLESMAVGLPVIVSDLPANRQWIDAAGGMVVATHDITAMVQALAALAQSADLCQQMGDVNRQRILRDANRQTEMDRMASLYQQLIELRK